MLILLSIIFPILSGIVLWHRNTRSGQNGHALYGAAIIITDVLAVLTMFFGKPVTLFSLSPKVTFSFSLDVMGKWFLFVSMVLYTCCLFYSFIYMKVQEREPTFYAFYFVSFGALIAVCCAANMVTIYFAFELTTLSTVPLVLHEQTQAAVAAGLKFLFYSIGGALLGLFGVFFLYTYAGAEVSFVPGGVLDLTKTAGHEPILYLAIFLGVIGYGTKAGLFPMHGWLPTAHPIAPAPASALLSGIITKSGVLVVIRFIYYSIGTSFIRGTWVQYTWLTLAMISILTGSMMAFQEKDLKKRLAYSSISQISYAMLGLALLTQNGLEGSLLQVMQHAPSKACLFLCAGAFIYRYGLKDVRQMKGIGKKMPIVLWCLTIAAMSLAGIPPMGGFISKWNLVTASLNTGMGAISVIGPIVLLISALLTAGYLFPITINGFFPGKGAEEEITDPRPEEGKGSIEAVPRMMWIPLICLCAVALIVGIFGGSLIELFKGIV